MYAYSTTWQSEKVGFCAGIFYKKWNNSETGQNPDKNKKAGILKQGFQQNFFSYAAFTAIIRNLWDSGKCR